MSAETKQYLQQAYFKQKRNLLKLREELKQSNDSIEDISKKIKLAEETHDLAKAAKFNQRDLDIRVASLERLSAKCETYAARANSISNATTEVRSTNQKIESLLEDVHKQEGYVAQAEIDCTAFEHEKEKLEQEKEDKSKNSQKKINDINGAIQKYREDISQVRFKNLTAFLNRQQQFASAEIELHKLKTMTMLYTQLCAQINFEISVLPDASEESLDKLNEELEKLENIITSIPEHTAISKEQQNNKKFQCESMLSDIKDLEARIIASIDEMSLAERNQDEFIKELHDEQNRNDQYKTDLRQVDILINEHEARIKKMQNEDANKICLAKLEIDGYKEKIAALSQSNLNKEIQISKFKDGLATPKNEIKSYKAPIDEITGDIRAKSKELSKQIDDLKAEESQLRMTLNNIDIH